jgi:excisionase family DNA binding protein
VTLTLVELPWAEQPALATGPGDGVTPSAAGVAVGVSSSTIRRWIDAGRVDSYRTTGGHRRIPRSELRRLVRELHPQGRIREVPLPEGPLPLFAGMLAESGERLVEVALRGTYEPAAPGWVAQPAARAEVVRWLGLLARTCLAGDYSAIIRRSMDLFGGARAAAPLLECQTFVERLSFATIREFRASDAGQAELLQAQRLTAVLRRVPLMMEDRLDTCGGPGRRPR